MPSNVGSVTHKYDSRCGEGFSNFSVAMVDCDQRTADVEHIDIETMVRYNEYTEEEAARVDVLKASVCRKTTQIGIYSRGPLS